MSNRWDELDDPSINLSAEQLEALERGEVLEGMEEEYQEEPQEEQYETQSSELDEEIADLLGEDESEMMENANIRLEKGRLYEMLMKTDIFEGTEGNKVAIATVRKELRAFCKEQLEIMLGMRAEKSKVDVAVTKVKLPFNELEIEALKAIASKLTKGESQRVDEQVEVEAKLEPVQQQIKRVAQRPPAHKPAGLRPISQSQPARRPVQQPLPSAPKQKFVRQPQRSPNPEPPRKKVDSVYDLTPEELAQRNALVPKKPRGMPSSIQPIPMPADGGASTYMSNIQRHKEVNDLVTGVLGAVPIETVD